MELRRKFCVIWILRENVKSELIHLNGKVQFKRTSICLLQAYNKSQFILHRHYNTTDIIVNQLNTYQNTLTNKHNIHIWIFWWTKFIRNPTIVDEIKNALVVVVVFYSLLSCIASWISSQCLHIFLIARF